MKRDLDLSRQLLIDIENRGVDCSVSVLRTGPDQEAEDRIRYHLRLLVDAGLLKEVDRTAGGIPCLRLTDDGHELLELARHEPRWVEAKRVCQDRIGGLSLTVIRGLLLRWAVQGVGAWRRRPRALVHYESRPAEIHREPYYYSDHYYRQRRPNSADGYRYETDRYDDAEWRGEDEVRYFRVRPEFRDDWRRSSLETHPEGRIDVEFDAASPDYLI